MVYQDIENDWTTTDTDGELSEATVTANWGTDAGGGGYERDDTGNHTRNFGAGFFGNVDIIFDFRFTAVEAGDADSRLVQDTFFALTNTSGAIGTDYLRIFPIQNGATDDQWYFRMRQHTGGVLDFLDSGTNLLSAGTTYYARLRRSGTTIDFDIYSTTALRAAGANGDAEALSDGGSGSNTTYQYGLLLVQVGNALDGSDHCSGWLTNVDMAYSAVSIPVMMHHYNRIYKKIRG
jgi:hypothetical protein